jgi:hypothetical protein
MESKAPSKLKKENYKLPTDMVESLEWLKAVTGRSKTELVRDYVAKGLKDDLEHHILKRKHLSGPKSEGIEATGI